MNSAAPLPNSGTDQPDDAQVFHMSGALRAKAAARPSENPGGADEMSNAAADAAMKNLSGDFHNWMNDEVNRLIAAYEHLRDMPVDDRNISPIYLSAKDMKSQATLYGYPLAGEIAGALTRMLDKIEPDYLPVQLIAHHIDAIRAIHRANVRDYAHPVAKQIVLNLNRAVDRLIHVRTIACSQELALRKTV